MERAAFTAPLPVARAGSVVAQPLTPRARTAPVKPRLVPRAELRLEPGIPSGIDPQENCPVDYYIQRTVDTYKDRSFTTVLPRNWQGEETSIGVTDVSTILESQKDTGANIEVSPDSDNAFMRYSSMMAQERRKALELLRTAWQPEKAEELPVQLPEQAQQLEQDSEQDSEPEPPVVVEPPKKAGDFLSVDDWKRLSGDL